MKHLFILPTARAHSCKHLNRASKQAKQKHHPSVLSEGWSKRVSTIANLFRNRFYLFSSRPERRNRRIVVYLSCPLCPRRRRRGRGRGRGRRNGDAIVVSRWTIQGFDSPRRGMKVDSILMGVSSLFFCLRAARRSRRGMPGCSISNRISALVNSRVISAASSAAVLLAPVAARCRWLPKRNCSFVASVSPPRFSTQSSRALDDSHPLLGWDFQIKFSTTSFFPLFLNLN